MQECRCRHGFDHHQCGMVSLRRRLFPRCKRTERLRLARSGRRAAKNQGTARLIVETNAGVIALPPAAVVARLQRVFADNAKEWREWAANIAKLSRPRAALDIAEFLLSLDSPN